MPSPSQLADIRLGAQVFLLVRQIRFSANRLVEYFVTQQSTTNVLKIKKESLQHLYL